MPKITIRLPTEQFAFIELEYKTTAEYVANYPTDALAIAETRKKAKELIKNNTEPF